MATATNNAANVTAGKPKIGGAIFCAPLGTTLPTDTTAQLAEAFMNLGYAGKDGVVNANSPETEKATAWGGDVVMNFQTGRPDTFKFTLLESMNVNVLKVIYGDKNVTGTLKEGITIQVNAEDGVYHCWVIDMILKGGAAKRIVIPNACITELGEISYVDNKEVGYSITLSALPDEKGQFHYEYIKAAA